MQGHEAFRVVVNGMLVADRETGNEGDFDARSALRTRCLEYESILTPQHLQHSLYIGFHTSSSRSLTQGLLFLLHA